MTTKWGAPRPQAAAPFRRPVKTPLKVVHLSSVHRAEDTRILHRECRTLVRAGFDVVFVVPHDGEFNHEGVRVHPLPPPKRRFGRLFGTVGKVLAAGLREDGDIYHYHDPELIPAALFLKIKGKRVVADVHEDVPADIRSKSWLPLGSRHILALTAALLQALAARSADAVIAATPAIARRLPPGRTTIIRNYPRIDEWDFLDRHDPCDRPPVVAYVGKIEADRGIGVMVEAVGRLGGVPGLRLVLAGDFEPPGFRRQLAGISGWEKVEWAGFLSRPQVGRLLGRARAGLVLLPPGPNHDEAEPNKLFEYMAAGLPVVASNFPKWKRLIEGTGCGLVTDPLDPVAVARSIGTILDDPERARAMGRRGRKAIEEGFNWGQESPRLIGLYEGLRRTLRR